MAQPYAGLSDEDATFGPLLAAASQLAVLAEARPNAIFAQTLEDRFLARATALADADMATQIGYNTPTLQGSDFPTLPGTHTFADIRADAPPRSGSARSTQRRETQQRRGFDLLRSRYPRLLPQAIAASLVLILGAGALTAAAAAGPGSLLFPLHRFEQGIQLGLSGSAADRFQLHLAYAGDALTALDAAHGNAGGRDKTTYAQALATLRDEERAAEKELTAVPSGTEHDDLAAQLQAFKTRATHDLYVALSPDATLSWQNRLATTEVLGQLGAPVPHIDAVHISRLDDASRTSDSSGSTSRDTQSWKVTITGTGFTPGAVVMINGHVAGAVTQLSPTQIIALVKADDPGALAGAIGIEEPDGSAVQTNDGLGDDGHSGAPNATATSTTHSGDSHSGDSHGGKGSGQDGTPTPTSTSTPTPDGGK